MNGNVRELSGERLNHDAYTHDTEWAKGVYQQGQLRGRRAEIVSLMIDEDIPPFVTEDEDTIVWAIYYARVSDGTKQRLLMERFSVETFDSLWQVSLKLRYSVVIENMRAKVREQLLGST